MREKLEVVSTLVVAASALVMVGFYVHDRPREPAAPFVKDWAEWDSAGVQMGSPDPDLVISVFIDFTCAFCQRLAPVLDSVMAEYPSKAAVRVHHFPLGRPGSTESAIAAECADAQGRFPDMYRAIYSRADSIGTRSWRLFAEDAGVRDLDSFEECIARPVEAFPRIAAGRSLGERIGVNGTPDIWVNGHRFNQGRSVSSYREKAADLGVRL